MKTQGEIEAAICEGIIRFEQDYMGRGPKDIQTLFGTIQVRRNYYYQPASQTGRVPLDQAMGLVHSFSPALVPCINHNFG